MADAHPDYRWLRVERTGRYQLILRDPDHEYLETKHKFHCKHCINHSNILSVMQKQCSRPIIRRNITNLHPVQKQKIPTGVELVSFQRLRMRLVRWAKDSSGKRQGEC
jgi:hypothetical protein